MKGHFLQGLALMALALGGARCVFAQSSSCGETMVDSGTPTAGGLFGFSLGVAGDLLVVGAPFESLVAFESGGAHVYRRAFGGWVHEQVIASPFPVPNQGAGERVGTNGTSVFLSTFRNDPGHVLNGNSAISVFRQQGGAWVEVQAIARQLSSAPSGFGSRFVVEPGGDRLIAILPNQKLYEFTDIGGTWTQTDVYNLNNLPAAFVTAASGGFYCWDLDLDGDRLVFTMNGVVSSAFVWRRTPNQWVPAHIVPAQFPGQFALSSASIDGDWLAVGVPSDLGFQGRVLIYAFDGSAWVLDQVIDNPFPGAPDYFGIDVELEGDLLVVGAAGLDVPGAQTAGGVHVFRRDGAGTPFEWVSLDTPGIAVPGGRMGYVVDVDGDRVLAGAYGGNNMPGLAHEFRLRADLGHALEGARPNSTGAAAQLKAMGSSVVGDACLTLEVSRLPIGQFGYFVMGQAQDSVPLFAGSQGHLSLGLPFQRFANDIQNSGLDGRVSLSPDFQSLPQGVQFQPGETWTFQYWTRDAAPMPTSNTSNALALTFEGDLAPTVQWPESLVERDEATALHTFTLTLSQPVTHDVEVEYVTGGTATHLVDWRVEASSPLVIPALATEIEVPIVFADDLLQEGDETATVTLVNPSGADLGTLPTLTIRIADDD